MDEVTSAIYNITEDFMDDHLDRVRKISPYLPILALQIIMGLIAVAVNLLVLSVFILGRVNNSLSYLLCNLAIANVLLGVALSTRSAIEIMNVNVGYGVQFTCHVTLMIAIMNMGTCITTIFCLCLNMYLSIGHPIKFRDGFSKKKTALFLALWWLFWVGYSTAIFGAASNSAESQESFSCNFASGAYHKNYVVTFVGFSLFISCLTVSFMYKTIKGIRLQMVKVSPLEGEVTGTKATNIASARRLHYMSITVAMILGMYILCWGPFMIAHFVVNTCPDQCSISDNTIISVSTLPIIHSLANILIYTYRSKEFKNILFGHIFKRAIKITIDPAPKSTMYPQPRSVVRVVEQFDISDLPYCGPDCQYK